MEQFEVMLVNILDALKYENIQGVRDFDYIMMDLDSRITKEITVLRNDQFELAYNKNTNEAVLKTTYSGQIINDEFINQLKIIDNAKGTIHTIINTMIALKVAGGEK